MNVREQSERLHSRRLTTIVNLESAESDLSANAIVLGNPRYLIRDEIDRGGMGLVCRAHDRLLERDVALKVLRLDPAAHAQAVHNFATEARIMSYLSHPGVTPVYSRGVIHLDLKPANIMVGPFGEVQIMDWGLARFQGPPP